MKHLLVTNDFPPKVGGIQSYLWELWRRLPPDDVTVLTTPHPDASRFDAAQAFRVIRTKEPVLLPNPVLVRHVRKLAAEVGAQAVVLDPALPLGLIGTSLGLPYAAVLHGSEVTVPGRLPGTKQLLARVLRGASLLIAAGGYPEAEARRAAGSSLPRVVQVPPGVDTDRFVPLPPIERAATRTRLGLPADKALVLSLSRLVPRKGMDTLIDAAARLAPTHPDLAVVIGGGGRDKSRLEHKIKKLRAPVKLLGRVSEHDMAGLFACADIFCLCCRNRWGGLEQEGFGIVFLEAGAAGVPSVAGQSGGAAEAVVDGETGVVVWRPDDAAQVARALAVLIDDAELRSRQGQAARRRVEDDFSYPMLAQRLHDALEAMPSPRAAAQ
ncbi:MAG: glycosyltransferase family 4 protein [Acidimicrobiales bacterium]